MSAGLLVMSAASGLMLLLLTLGLRASLRAWQHSKQRALASFPPDVLRCACTCSPALALHVRRAGTASRRQVQDALSHAPSLAGLMRCE